MGVLTSVFGFVGEIFRPVTDLVDSLHTSEEERAEIRARLLELQHAFGSKILEYETRLMEAQAKVLTAEAQSESTITRTWRPITMLTFVGLIVWRWVGPTFGLPQAPVSEGLELELMALIKIGLGGYVIGRSAEKVVPRVVEAVRARSED